MSKRIRILLSVVCAGVAMVFCLSYTSHVREEADRMRTEAMRRYGGEVASLVVTTRQIEAGEVIATKDVEQRDWLSSLAPEGAQTSLDDVVGREVSVPASAGAPLTELNFRDLAHLADIPAGHVAVSVPITEKLGVSVGIAVGTHVVAYRTTQDSAQAIGDDAVVLAVPGGSGTAGRGSLTIAVLAKDVPAVLTASASGDLRLVVPASDVNQLASSTKGGVGSVAPVSGDESAHKEEGK